MWLKLKLREKAEVRRIVARIKSCYYVLVENRRIAGLTPVSVRFHWFPNGEELVRQENRRIAGLTPAVTSQQ
jgi:hypothetical protein